MGLTLHQIAVLKAKLKEQNKSTQFENPVLETESDSSTVENDLVINTDLISESEQPVEPVEPVVEPVVQPVVEPVVQPAEETEEVKSKKGNKKRTSKDD